LLKVRLRVGGRLDLAHFAATVFLLPSSFFAYLMTRYAFRPETTS
jgi:hypothetical protein